MLYLFTNVAQVAPQLLKMLQSVASSYHVKTLFQLLLIASPKCKLDIICIIRNLIHANLHLEKFNEALVDPLLTTDDGELLFLKNMSNPLAEFLYKYAVKIRAGLVDKEAHMYAVSKQLVKTALEVCEKVNVAKTQKCFETAVEQLHLASDAE